MTIELTPEQIETLADAYGRTPNQLQEAIADANANEFERLKDFGYFKGRMQGYSPEMEGISPQEWFEYQLKRISQ
jgi:hypothetical protein